MNFMKQFTGTVISTKMLNTVIVEVRRNWKHPLYKKVVSRTKNFSAHVQDMELVDGDTVIIQECRPMSKTKHFTVVQKVQQ